MDRQYQHSLRVGVTAILCATAIRLSATPLPEAILSRLTQPNTAAFLIYLETGRDVRFSPSSEVFSPQFVESPPPAIPTPTEAPIPTYKDTDLIDMYNTVSKHPDLETLLARPLSWDLRGDEPTVLILHTHGTESYTRQDEDYEETASWRTLDEDFNMLSIGRRVGQILAESGITALQDREIHDYPSYNGSYVHARKSIEAYLKKYPTIRLVLDLHRDASAGERGQLRTLATVGGETSAQLMIVLGANHDAYEDNLSLALKLHSRLESENPGIMRPLQLRAQRFNQDLSPGALLVEVGAAGNTHREAMLAAEELAAAVIALARGTR